MVTDALTTLREARERIKGGWCQGTARQTIAGQDHYCLVAALFQSRRALSAQYRAENIIRALIGDTVIHAWNDKPGRTKSQVLDLIDRAIALEESHP